jgi:two-component SAPR family response regulator
VLLSPGLIKEELETFLDKLNSANPELAHKIVLIGKEQDFENCAMDIKLLPFLSKPFSLDHFEEIVKAMRK